MPRLVTAWSFHEVLSLPFIEGFTRDNRAIEANLPAKALTVHRPSTRLVSPSSVRNSARYPTVHPSFSKGASTLVGRDWDHVICPAAPFRCGAVRAVEATGTVHFGLEEQRAA